MKEVILIGTIHLGLTPIEELVSEVVTYNPDRVLIEVDKEGNGAEEMKLLLDWCKENNVEYRCFDTAVPAEKSASRPTQREIIGFAELIKKKLHGVSWKDLNNRLTWESTGAEDVNQAFTDKFYDLDKIETRNKLIEQNIPPLLTEGTNVVVTGAGHLTHLLAAIPGSTAPLRQPLNCCK